MRMLTPYLFFNGNCREAMTFYKSSLGGELQVMTYADAQGAECPEALKDKVMHSHLRSGDALLMASDVSPNEKVMTGTNVHMSASCSSIEEIENLYKVLSAGGKALMPLHDAF